MYPITYEADFNPTPNRWTTFFRILLAIPWFVVGVFWGILFVFTHFFAWVAVVILGRYPQWLYDFNSGVIRFGTRISAWFWLQTDVWPPFSLNDDPSYPIRVNFPAPAASQSRLKAFFRVVLVFPVAVILTYGTSQIVQFVGIVAWLTVVFRGYLPEWLFDTLTHLHSFQARVWGYATILTDDYPPIGLEKSKPVSAAPATTTIPEPPAAPTV